MQKIIKGKSVFDDDWVLITDLDETSNLSDIADHSIIPVKFWLAHQEVLAPRSQNLGIWLDSDENPDSFELSSAALTLPIIAINFPAFTDGRGYSYARRLKEHYKFVGEIRAIGNVLVDQLYYMSRCGFDSFALQNDKQPEDALNALAAFSDNYQSSLEQAKPLFKRL